MSGRFYGIAAQHARTQHSSAAVVVVAAAAAAAAVALAGVLVGVGVVVVVAIVAVAPPAVVRLCCNAHRNKAVSNEIDNWNHAYLSIVPVGYSITLP